MLLNIQIAWFTENTSKIQSPKKLLLLIMAAFISLFLMSCQKEKKAEPEKLVNVQCVTVHSKMVQPKLETTGTLKADQEVIVSSEVDGVIKNIYAEEGMLVNTATILAKINETDYQLDWQRSAAALKQAQASLVNARAEYQRKAALFAEELVTKQQFDDVHTRLALAEADVDRAQATLAMAQEKLARTKIYSPLRGAVKEKKVSIGDYVRNGSPLFLLIQTDPLKLNFTVSEKDLAYLKIGQEVVFTVDALADGKFQGKVNLLYPNVEEKTRTLQAQAIVSNASQLLKPGSFTRVFIYTQAPRKVVLAPLTALLYDNESIHVFVIEKNTARKRVIKIGGKYGEFIEVCEGLKEDEKIVVAGQNNLSEGVKVNVAR